MVYWPRNLYLYSDYQHTDKRMTKKNTFGNWKLILLHSLHRNKCLGVTNFSFSHTSTIPFVLSSTLTNWLCHANIAQALKQLQTLACAHVWVMDWSRRLSRHQSGTGIAIFGQSSLETYATWATAYAVVMLLFPVEPKPTSQDEFFFCLLALKTPQNQYKTFNYNSPERTRGQERLWSPY